MAKSKPKRLKTASKSVTTCSLMPPHLKEFIANKMKCDLLHEKTLVYHDGKIYRLCPICDIKKTEV